MNFMDVQAVFAENMKKYRKQAKITQEKLAELCDTDYRYIGQIETGHRCPSLEFVGKIASALKLAPYRLFYDENIAENEESATLRGEQKQKIKTMLIENITRICSMIDEH
jgi:transcriptional regulator with XRE-family HTH domain